MKRKTMMALVVSILAPAAIWSAARSDEAAESYLLKIRHFDGISQEVRLQGSDSFDIATTIGAETYALRGKTQVKADRITVTLTASKQWNRKTARPSPDTITTEMNLVTVGPAIRRIGFDGKEIEIGQARPTGDDDRVETIVVSARRAD